MPYKKYSNDRNYNNAYGSNQYNQSNGYQGGNNYGPQAQRAPAKKSGATYTKIRKGNYIDGTIVNAWNVSKSRGLITATVAPYHKSEELVESEKGNQYVKMMASVEFRSTGNTKLMPCLMNIKTQVIVLRDLGMVITPNGSGHTSSGKKVTGYFGTMTKK